MKRTGLLVVLLGAAAVCSWTTEALCASGDPFANRRREVELRKQQERDYTIVKLPWGGPTTPSSWWPEVRVWSHEVRLTPLWTRPWFPGRPINVYYYNVGPFGQVFIDQRHFPHH